MHDQELRERFATWARQLQGAAPPPVSVIRRRARRRMARLTAAAAAAMAVTGVIVVLVISALPGTAAPPRPAGPGPAPVTGGPGPASHSPAPASHSPAPASHSAPASHGPALTARQAVPPGSPYLFTLHQGKAKVRNAATGTVLRTYISPGQKQGNYFTWVAAAAGDRLFVLADQRDVTETARFYEIAIDSAGRPGPLRPVPHSVAVTGEIYGLAVSPDGSEVAVATTPARPGPGPSKIHVFGPGSAGGARTWSSTAGGAGALSWVGDARLSFSWQDNGSADGQSGLRILNPRSVPPGGTGSLTGSSRLLGNGPPFSEYGQLTPDGSRVLVISDDHGKVYLQELSAASAQVLRSVQIGTAAAQNSSPNYCGVLWSSATGDTVLTQCGNLQQRVNGSSVRQMRLGMAIRASPVGWANNFAW